VTSAFCESVHRIILAGDVAKIWREKKGGKKIVAKMAGSILFEATCAIKQGKVVVKNY
jgi:hypothetical protein